MPRFFVVTRVVCNRCGRHGPGVPGEYDAKSAAVEQAKAKGWTKRRQSTLYQYDHYCPGCSADPPMPHPPIVELSTDH